MQGTVTKVRQLCLKLLKLQDYAHGRATIHADGLVDTNDKNNIIFPEVLSNIILMEQSEYTFHHRFFSELPLLIIREVLLHTLPLDWTSIHRDP